MGLSPRPPDDRALVRRFLRSGSEASFRALYRAHTPALYGFALRLARGDPHAAQDIVQEAWVRAIRKLDEFRWRSSLKTWLHAVALNVHREGLRRRTTAERHDHETQHRFTVIRGAGEPALDIEQAISELPDGQREVLIMHDIEGYTHREIATLLDIAEGTSKSQLSRARAAVRARLDGKGASRHAG
jgi:RNA polymerase sigma-70 factor (ECF subfamily)